MFRALIACACLAGLMLIVSPLPAVARGADETVKVRLRNVDRPQSSADAERLLDRIEAAQSEACGALPSSFPEYRRAIRRGSCWNEGVARTVEQLNSALLTDALARRRKPRRQP